MSNERECSSGHKEDAADFSRYVHFQLVRFKEPPFQTKCFLDNGNWTQRAHFGDGKRMINSHSENLMEENGAQKTEQET